MVKRKANVSIDDWLGERASPSITITAPTVTVEEELGSNYILVPTPISAPASSPVAPNVSANEVTAWPVPVEPVAPTGDDVAVNHEEAAEWFWNLLAQSEDTKVDTRTGVTWDAGGSHQPRGSGQVGYSWSGLTS